MKKWLDVLPIQLVNKYLAYPTLGTCTIKVWLHRHFIFYSRDLDTPSFPFLQICFNIWPEDAKEFNVISYSLDQRFSTQITPLPVFWRKKFPKPATEDFYHLKRSSRLVLPYFQQKYISYEQRRALLLRFSNWLYN